MPPMSMQVQAMTTLEETTSTLWRAPDEMFDEAQLAAVAFLARYSGRTLDAYRHDLRAFFQWATDKQLVVLKATRPHIELYRAASEERGLAASTIDRRLSTVCGFNRFAHIDGRIAANPAQYVRRPKVQPSEGHGMDRAELGTFLFTAERFDRDGFSKGAIYSNFTNKEDLFLTLMDHQVRQRVQVARDVVANCTDPGVTAEEIGQRLMALYLDGKRGYMSRLPEVDLESSSAEVREILGVLPNLSLFRLLAHAETVLPSWLTMGGTLLSGLSVPPRLRELVILQVAATTSCDYERVQHVAIAQGVGVPQEQVDAVVAQDLDADCLRDYADLLRAVDHLIRNQALTTPEFAALRGELDERQTVELLIVIGWYLSIALIAGAVDLAPDPAANMAVVDSANAHLGGTR